MKTNEAHRSIGATRLKGAAVLVAMALVAVSCGGGSTTSAAAEEAVGTTIEPTAAVDEPTPEPEPTQVPPEPTATPRPEPTATPGPDFDGDGIPDDADDDDDGDGVLDDVDDFPQDIGRSVRLESQFPLVDGVAQLPDLPSVRGLRWLQEQFEAETTTAEQVQEQFAPSFLANFSAQQVAEFINTERPAVIAFEPLDPRAVSDFFLWIQMGNPEAPLGSATKLTQILIEPDTGLINGFRIENSTSGMSRWVYAEDKGLSIADAVELLGTKAPNSSILVAEITDDGCSVIAGKDETVKRGVASLFKTWVLGALATQIEAGVLSRSDPITMTPGEFIIGGSTVSSQFGVPTDLTVQQVANLMIQISDNGATDIVHSLVGRDLIDAYVEQSGFDEPAALTPVLTLSEFNHLYGNVSFAETRAYTSIDEQAQADFVENVLAPMGVWTTNRRGNVELTQDITWQASPMDTCNNMATLRNFDPASEAGMLIDEAYGGEVALFGVRNEWDRVWFKGGSHPAGPETQVVLSHGWMVESNDGRAYAVISMHNSPSGLPTIPLVFELQSLHTQIINHLVRGTGGSL